MEPTQSSTGRNGLSDADIASRTVSRRSMLKKLGIGAGFAVAVVGGPTAAHANTAICDNDSSDGRGHGSGSNAHYCDDDPAT